MSFNNVTAEYELWLKTQIVVIDKELDEKHEKITCSEFEFLRATFYRWAQLWAKHCSPLDDAPKVLGVGDLHVENFGTWRDIEGRLAWGVNDFDEACCLPYTNDLVRLAASAYFAIQDRGNDLELEFEQACKAIQDGYAAGLEQRVPFVLAERHDWLRNIVVSKLLEKDGKGKNGKNADGRDKDKKDEFDKFLEEYTELPKVTSPIPVAAREAMNAAFPDPSPLYQICRRKAGLGSLGRQRFTAVAEDWCGGIIVREAKALAPSAWLWANQERDSFCQAGLRNNEIWYAEALRNAVRSHDPWLRVHKGWVVRRLGPDAFKIRLKDLKLKLDGKSEELTKKLLLAMGRETANVHSWCDNSSDGVSKHLKGLSDEYRSSDWLFRAAMKMVEETKEDFEDWKRAGHHCPPEDSSN
jgi:Uncharacterized protein conserved in bacteria (DUF2252)